MRASLKRHGYLVAEATNDAEAFEVAEREPIELILTEEKLPTFQSLLARLRGHPVFSRLPVAIINPDAEDGERCEDAHLLADYTSIASLLPSLRR
jgi:response regulator RpfG family c-di-GMP phosphodiesterase